MEAQSGRLLGAVVIFCCLLGTIKAVLPDYEVEEPLLYDTFPESFLWGTATAAYQVCTFFVKKEGHKSNFLNNFQIEGAWNEDGKGQRLVHSNKLKC